MASYVDESTMRTTLVATNPISHLHVPPLLGDDDGHMLAANTCDCILRVSESRSKFISIALVMAGVGGVMPWLMKNWRTRAQPPATHGVEWLVPDEAV